MIGREIAVCARTVRLHIILASTYLVSFVQFLMGTLLLIFLSVFNVFLLALRPEERQDKFPRQDENKYKRKADQLHVSNNIRKAKR